MTEEESHIQLARDLAIQGKYISTRSVVGIVYHQLISKCNRN